MVDEVWGLEVDDLCLLLLLLWDDWGDRFSIMVDDVCGLVVFFRLDDEDEDLLLVLERLDLLMRWLDLEDIDELFVFDEWELERE